MDQRRGDGPQRLPVVPEQSAPPPPSQPPPSQPPPSSSPRPDATGRPAGPRFSWRRLTRTPRGAAGLVIVVAALLLWPFAGWSVIPWIAGFGLLVLLRLLRLDGLLRGWVLHLGGLVVVAGLMLSTGPWAWALAGSIGMLLAGLAQLPAWRLAAVGTVLVVISGAGFGFSSYRAAEVAREVQSRAGDPLRIQLGETRPGRVLPAMVQGVALDDADPICRLLSPGAETAILAATRAPDCAAAVAELNRRLPAGAAPDQQALPEPQPIAGGGWQVDACETSWATAAGRAVGRVLIVQADPAVQRYAVSGFAPC